MKKLGLILVMILILVSLTATACDNGDNGEDDVTPTPVATATQTPKPTQTEEPLSKELLDLLRKAEEIECLNYVMTISYGDITGTTSVWQTGNKQKALITAPEELGGESIMIMDGEALVGYIIREGIAIPTDITPEQVELSLNQTAVIMDYNPSIVGKDTYDDMSCTIIEYSQYGQEFQVWLWDDYGMPVKVTGFISMEPATWEYKDINFDCVSNDTFDLPEGVEIQEIPY